MHTNAPKAPSSALARAVQEGDITRAREIDEALAPVYELLGVVTNPIAIKAALRLPLRGRKGRPGAAISALALISGAHVLPVRAHRAEGALLLCALCDLCVPPLR